MTMQRRSESINLAAGNAEERLRFIGMSIPGLHGLAVTSQVKAREAPPKVVIMTLEDSEEHRTSAIVAGDDAFLPKDHFASEFHLVVETLFGAGVLQL